MTTPTNDETQRSRTLLTSFLGAIVHRLDNWMPIGGTVELLTPLGMDAASVRTAVFRLKRRGWLDAEARSGVRGYRLTELALGELTAGDEIIWHPREPAAIEDGWCIVTYSVPEARRDLRHQLRAALTSLGFGNLSAGVWIAPARMRSSATEAITGLDLLDRCVVFHGDYAAGEPLSALLSRSFDLPDTNRRYCEFVERNADLGVAQMSDADVFAEYLRVVDQWRKIPYRDPVLPVEVLPDDWAGQEAGRLFERRVRELEPIALRHAAARWP